LGDGGQRGKAAKDQSAKEKRKALDAKSAGTQHRHPRGSCCKKAVLLLLLLVVVVVVVVLLVVLLLLLLLLLLQAAKRGAD
jgi:Flp pilus assembly protein TadB